MTDHTELVSRFTEVCERMQDADTRLSVSLEVEDGRMGAKAMIELQKAAYDLTCGDEDPTMSDEVINALETAQARIHQLETILGVISGEIEGCSDPDGKMELARAARNGGG